jgi:hypothetical protein
MNKRWWLVGLAVALIVAFLSPLASSSPDGLERVAEDQGFIGAAQDPSFEVIPDYVFPGVANEAVATILAGITGTLVLYAAMYGVGRLLAKKGAVN